MNEYRVCSLTVEAALRESLNAYNSCTTFQRGERVQELLSKAIPHLREAVLKMTILEGGFNEETGEIR